MLGSNPMEAYGNPGDRIARSPGFFVTGVCRVGAIPDFP